MKVHSLHLHRISMPLVRAFETSFGRQSVRDVLLVEVITDVGQGWGECVAGTDPVYSSEYVAGCQHIIENHLAPALLAASRASREGISAEGLEALFSFVIGHRMAKAAIEAAVLDAQLRAAGISFGTYLGATRTEVDCGVSVGIAASIDELLAEVEGYVNDGYRRIKLKIRPGWDIEPVRAVRTLIGARMMLQVDANTAYTVGDIDHLRHLDQFDLLLIEQPFVEENIRDHVTLAHAIDTRVCLDESITSAAVAIDAIERDATSIVNIKPGRVGGYIEAVRIHDACVLRDVPVWCGGMLETGLGRAANIALAGLPGFRLPGDTSASARYYAEDLTEPFVLEGGRLRVPTSPGTGVEVRRELIGAWAQRPPVVIG